MAISVSLIIPAYNEEKTLAGLIHTIRNQSLLPEEVIVVDGGSGDNTVGVFKQLVGNDSRFRIIEAGRAMPGEGRNIGAGQAICEWIAFTDAGIELDTEWLKNLVIKAEEDEVNVSIVYGNLDPVIKTFFEKCSTITYMSPKRERSVRFKSIASCLLKKKVWEKAGGFPPWRAAEDLIFMKKAEETGGEILYAIDAMAYWELRPDIKSMYRKFDLYSKNNVWAGYQAYWHYGVARQYGIACLFLILGIFVSVYWLIFIPIWLGARTAWRILSHRYEFGLKTLFNPAVFFMVMFLSLLIDVAMFSGWLKAHLDSKKVNTKN